MDFGDFESAVYQKNVKNNISFSFNISGFDANIRLNSPNFYFDSSGSLIRSRSKRRRVVIDNVRITFFIAWQLRRTVIKAIKLEFLNDDVEVEFGFAKDGKRIESVLVNGKDCFSLFDKYMLYFISGKIFSSFRVYSSEDGIIPVGVFCSMKIQDIIKNKGRVSKKVSSSTVMQESRRFMGVQNLDVETLFEISEASKTKTFEKFYRRLSKGELPEVLTELSKFHAINSACSVLDQVGEGLSDLFRSVTYLGPARARGERFYRYQELEVSEIAPDGQNLPMFLSSLPEHDLAKFSKWVEGLFGYGIKTTRSTGHLSIDLVKNDYSVNVADTGYGVSQLLPVLAQVWWSTNGDVSGRYKNLASSIGFRTLAIEQPELHLHPAHQAKLADVFAEAINQSEDRSSVSSSIRLLIETHSESLINRLGELIYQGKLNKNDVQIVVFGGESAINQDNVNISTFDDEGILKDWPYGFFNYV